MTESTSAVDAAFEMAVLRDEINRLRTALATAEQRADKASPTPTPPSDVIERLRARVNPRTHEGHDPLCQLAADIIGALQVRADKAERERDEARAERDEWRTIDTAPKDGTIVLAHYTSPHGPRVGPIAWRQLDKDKQGFLSFAILTETKKATHWRPLPKSPEAGKDSGERP